MQPVQFHPSVWSCLVSACPPGQCAVNATTDPVCIGKYVPVSEKGETICNSSTALTCET